MATYNHNIEMPLDAFANLACAYEALANLAHDSGYADSPIMVILNNLNQQFRASLDRSSFISGLLS
jgi:hypothetical protein